MYERAWSSCTLKEESGLDRAVAPAKQKAGIRSTAETMGIPRSPPCFTIGSSARGMDCLNAPFVEANQWMETNTMM